jgi:sterol desaturase/sphingolipid hydroxylase (fatty acid hydroxylase superfamily)
MPQLEAIYKYFGIFFSQIKELFLSENSRLWWAWLVLFYPVVGAVIAVIELRREKKPVTIGSVFRFVFPAKIYKSDSFKNDLIIVSFLFLFYSVVLSLFAGIESKMIVGKLVGFITKSAGENEVLAPYKATVSAGLGVHLFFTFLVILAYDFGFTLMHYAYHRVPFLWNLHKVHHSAEHLTPFTVMRFHLGEYIPMKIVEGLCIGSIFGIFYFILPQGLDLYKIFGLSIFGILFSAIGVFRHSHIWISYGFMNYIFCSPAMHQIHHSAELKHRDKNLSQIFSFWDALLGTLYIPKEKETFQVGLGDEKVWNDGSWKKPLTAHLRADQV